jgi:hypothetical protein
MRNFCDPCGRKSQSCGHCATLLATAHWRERRAPALADFVCATTRLTAIDMFMAATATFRPLPLDKAAEALTLRPREGSVARRLCHLPAFQSLLVIASMVCWSLL